MLLNDAIEAYIDSRLAARRLRPTTERTYRHHLGHFAEYIGETAAIDTITKREVQRWLSSMGHLRASSLRTAEAPVRALFGWALEEGAITEHPMATIPRPPQARPIYRGLEPDVIGRLLHVADFRERTILLLGLHLGLRCAEMSRANFGDWDRRRGTILVHGKGGADRVLPVVGEIEWALDLWAEGRRSGPMFPSQHADRLGPSSISQIVTRVARRANVEATAHQLRHSCAHDMLAMGAKPNAVQRFLGHTTLTTTTTYLTARDDELRAAMCRVYAMPEDRDAA
ncbi:MAG: tyrosine-type recombinase/integrase [Actinomycetota bacterium]